MIFLQTFANVPLYAETASRPRVKAVPVDAEVFKSFESAAKRSQDVQGFLAAFKPSIGEKWFAFLSQKVPAKSPQKHEMQVRGQGDYVFTSQGQTLSLQVADMNAGKFSVNHKPYSFDAAKTPDQIWGEISELMPKKSARNSPLDLVLPQAHAQLIMVVALGALAVGAVAAIDSSYKAKNCNFQMQLMKPLCFRANSEEDFKEAVHQYYEVNTKGVGICGAKNKNLGCVRAALQSDRVPLSEITDSGERAFLTGLSKSASGAPAGGDPAAGAR